MNKTLLMLFLVLGTGLASCKKTNQKEAAPDTSKEQLKYYKDNLIGSFDLVGYDSKPEQVLAREKWPYGKLIINFDGDKNIIVRKIGKNGDTISTGKATLSLDGDKPEAKYYAILDIAYLNSNERFKVKLTQYYVKLEQDLIENNLQYTYFFSLLIKK